MNALLVANWPFLLAFFGGALLGLGAGWLLRSWREPEGKRAAAGPAAGRTEQRADGGAERRHGTDAAVPAVERRRSTVRPAAPAARLTDAEGDDAIGPAILLIDDRLELLGMHATYLRQHGYRTLLADSGTAGLAFARRYQPALIVLDHSMPDRTGVEVARELKADAATRDIPILLMTAMSYGAVGAAAMEAGCEAYLSKPIEPSRLLREIEARAPRH